MNGIKDSSLSGSVVLLDIALHVALAILLTHFDVLSVDFGVVRHIGCAMSR